MYAPTADRTSPWLAQLARLQAGRSSAAVQAFDAQLAAARNEVAHYAAYAAPATSSGLPGLGRKRRLQAG